MIDGWQSGSIVESASVLKRLPFKVRAVAWSPDGQRIASGGGKQVRIWNATTGADLLTYNRHTPWVETVAWSPQGKYIASGDRSGIVQIWDPTTGNTVLTYRGYPSSVNALAWSPDGTRMASGKGQILLGWGDEATQMREDGVVEVWDVATGNTLVTFGDHSIRVLAVAWSPDRSIIAFGGGGYSLPLIADPTLRLAHSPTIQIWDVSTRSRLFTYRGHTASVSAIAWSPDGLRIASGSKDQTVQVWAAPADRKLWPALKGRNILTYQGHSGSVWAVAWSPDGLRIASGSTDTTVRVWDVATGSTRFTCSGHSGFVAAVAWSPDGTYLASASTDSTVQVWRVV